jgi:O-antigen/teichoic acid export membrane protein
MAIRRFLLNSAWYSIANLVSRGLAFLLLPLYARTLQSFEIGAYELLTAISMALAVLLPLEITQAVARLRTSQGNVRELQSQIVTAFTFTIIVFGLFSILVILLSPWLSVSFLDSRLSVLVPILAVVLLFINGVFYFLQNELRWANRPQLYVFVSFISALITAILACIFLLIFKWSLSGLYSALIIGNIAAISIAIWKIPEIAKIKIDSHHLLTLIKFSTPLAISSLFLILAMTIDRYMVAHFLSLESLGKYGVAMRVASLAMFGFQGFQLAALPATLGDGEQGNAEKTIEQFSRAFLVMAFVVAIALGVFSREALDILATKAYSGSATLVPIVLIGIVFSAIYPFAPGLWLRGHTWLMALSSMSISVLGFLFSYVLIPYADSIGASIAFAFTGIFYASIMVLMSDRVYPVGRQYGPLVYASILFILGSALMAWMLDNEISLIWRIALAILIAIFATLFLLNKDERRKVFIKARTQFSKWAVYGR